MLQTLCLCRASRRGLPRKARRGGRRHPWSSSCCCSSAGGLPGSRGARGWAPPSGNRSCSEPSCWWPGTGCKVSGSWGYSSWRGHRPPGTSRPRCFWSDYGARAEGSMKHTHTHKDKLEQTCMRKESKGNVDFTLCLLAMSLLCIFCFYSGVCPGCFSSLKPFSISRLRWVYN